MPYSKEFVKAFKFLNKNMDPLDVCSYLNISGQKYRQIRKELGLDGLQRHKIKRPNSAGE